MTTGILSPSNKSNILASLALKDRSQVHMTSSNARSDSRPAKQREQITSPEPDSDPVRCKSYLISPLETILESLDDYDWEYISCHDIIEAYSVLSSRIRSIAHAMALPVDQPLSALLPVKEHATALARALKRDIRRVLLDPYQGMQNTPVFYDSYSSDVSMTDHDLQHALDISTLCHHGLRVLSDIFTFRMLYVLIPVLDLNDLLSEILKIALAIELPTPNACKTLSLVFWIIQSQQLPLVILEPRKGEIVSALRDALNGQKGLQAKYDSLKAINSLLNRHPALFMAPLTKFLFTILTNLISADADCRLQACNALSGLVLAKINHHTEFPHEAISQEVHAFMKPQVPPKDAALSKRPEKEKFPLHYYLSLAFGPEASDTKDPPWAVITLACLIVLSDRWLYTRHELRFCAECLEPAFKHKRKEVKQLAMAAWGGLVWAFTLLPTMHPKWNRPEDANLPDGSLGLRGKAFRFLNHNPSGGKGLSVVRGLLLSSGGDSIACTGNVSRALLVLRSIVGRTQISYAEAGVKVLCRLVSAIGVTGRDEAVDEEDSVAQMLLMFDGTLLEATSRKLRDVARRVSDVNFNHIRALSEAEVGQHWEALVETWGVAMDRSLQPSAPLVQRELMTVWQSLLLVRTNVTQEHGHLTASGAFASLIADIATRFLVQANDTQVQVQRLGTVKRLWGVMKNVFSASWLPAEKILAGVLKVNFSLDDEQVKGAWSELCADLISVGVPTVLHIISTGSEGQEVTRQLWTVLARTWQVPDKRAHWEELVSFLVIPFKSWVMSSLEFGLWERVLYSSISMASSDSVHTHVVVERVLRRLGEKENDALVDSPQSVMALTSYIDLCGCAALPHVFAIINRTLLVNYPPRPESLATCLGIIRLLGQMIVAVPCGLLIQLVCAVEKGACCWIGDEKVAMLVREHDAVVQELYCSTLERLRDLPRSLQTLIAISPFLSSAFGRLSSSAMGPLTFDQFWRATYHGIEEYRTSYPDCLKACLLGMSDAYGGSMAEGLSMSQGTVSATIPDSQPTYLDQEEAWFSRIDRKAPVQRSSLSPTSRKQVYPEPPTKRRRISTPPVVNEFEASAMPRANDLVEKDGHLPSSLQIEGIGSYGLSTPRMTPREPSGSISRKRSPEIVLDAELTKKRKTESDIEFGRSRLQNRVKDEGIPESSPFSKVPIYSPLATPMFKDHLDSRLEPPAVRLQEPEPLSPEVPFSVSPPAESMSQNTHTRKRKRIIDWVNMSRNIQNSAFRGGTSRMSSSVPDTPVRGTTVPAEEEEEEDYDSWETRAVSREDIMLLRQELVDSDGIVPETEEESLDEETDLPSEDFLNASGGLLGTRLGPSYDSHRRSQTVPLRPPPSPIKRARTASSSTRIDALERAYTAVAIDGSQIPVEDLVHATGVVNKIQSALNEQLTRRLAKSAPASKR